MADQNSAAAAGATPAEPVTAPGGFFETENVYEQLEGKEGDPVEPKTGTMDLEAEDGKKPEDKPAPTDKPADPKPEDKPVETTELTGLTPELATKFGDLKKSAPELAEFMVKQEKERSAAFTRKTQQYAEAIKEFQDFRPAFEDKTVGNAVRFILSDPEAGQAVADVIRAIVTFRQSGKKEAFNLKNHFSTQAPPPDGLMELLGKPEDELMETFLTKPGYLKAVIERLAGSPKKEDAEPTGGTTPLADPTPVDTNTLVSSFFSARPEADRAPEFISAVTKWVGEHEAALVKEGHGPEAILVAAYSAVAAKREAAAEAKKQADQDKAKTEQQERRGLPPQGAGHTEEEADDELGLKKGSFFAKP